MGERKACRPRPVTPTRAASCSGGPSPGPDPCHRLLRGQAVVNPQPASYTNVTSPLPNLTISSGDPGLQHWLPGAEFVFGKGASGASWTEPRCGVVAVRASTTVLSGAVDIEMAMPCWARATGKLAAQ